MTELEDKITGRLSLTNEFRLDQEDTVALTNYLFQFDEIRNRVVDKTDLRNEVLKMRKPKKHSKLINTLRQLAIDGDVDGVEKELASLSADDRKEMDAIITAQFNEACKRSGIIVSETKDND